MESGRKKSVEYTEQKRRKSYLNTRREELKDTLANIEHLRPVRVPLDPFLSEPHSGGSGASY